MAKVEVERHLVLMAGRGFDRAVCEARAEEFAWEQVVEHLPGFKTAYGAEAAAKLFESMSVFGSSFGQRYVSWRCGDCDGLVVDSGPSAAIPLTPSPAINKNAGAWTERPSPTSSDLTAPTSTTSRRSPSLGRPPSRSAGFLRLVDPSSVRVRGWIGET